MNMYPNMWSFLMADYGVEMLVIFEVMYENLRMPTDSVKNRSLNHWKEKKMVIMQFHYFPQQKRWEFFFFHKVVDDISHEFPWNPDGISSVVTD